MCGDVQNLTFDIDESAVLDGSVPRVKTDGVKPLVFFLNALQCETGRSQTRLKVNTTGTLQCQTCSNRALCYISSQSSQLGMMGNELLIY